jgi:hypothetical protein
MNNQQSNEQESLITLPLTDHIWNILGDDSNGAMCARVTPLTGKLLAIALKDSLRWIVEFEDKDGVELEYPILWRYSEWKTSADTYAKQKAWAHKCKVEGWILDKNVDNLARSIMRSTRMSIEQARPIAYAIIHKGGGNIDVLKVLGVNKLVTKEEEL